MTSDSGLRAERTDAARASEKSDLGAPSAGHAERPMSVHRMELRLLVALLLLVLLFAAMFPEQFASARNAENIARHGAILLVVAVGQMFALLVGGFDISVGANMGLSSTIAAMVMLRYGVPAGVLAGLAVGLTVGLVNGLLIARFRVSAFIATLGMLTFAVGLANYVSNGRSVHGLPTAFRYLGRANWGPIPSSVALAALLLAAAWVLLNHTRIGLYLYAIGGSRDAARLAGVRVVRHEIFAYTMCGLLASAGGIMLASRVTVGQAGLGQGYELLSIATAVIGGVAIGGGVGRLLGVVLGVAILSVMTTGMNIAGLSEFIQQMLTGAVLIAAVLVDRFRGRRGSGIVPVWRREGPDPGSGRPTRAGEPRQDSNP